MASLHGPFRLTDEQCTKGYSLPSGRDVGQHNIN